MSQLLVSKVHSVFPDQKVYTFTSFVEVCCLFRGLFLVIFLLTGLVRVTEQSLLLGPEPRAGSVLHPGGYGEVVG